MWRKRLLLASSAIPGIFPSEEIEGEMYVDGGLVDNIPVKPLYDMGCDFIIVVHLDRTNYDAQKAQPGFFIINYFKGFIVIL